MNPLLGCLRSLTASFDAFVNVKYRTDIFVFGFKSGKDLSRSKSPLKHTVRLTSLSTNDNRAKDRHKHHDSWFLAGLLGSYALTSKVLKAGEGDDDEKIIKKNSGTTKRDTKGKFSRTAARSKSEQMKLLRSVKRKLKYPEETEPANYHLTRKKAVRKLILPCTTISAKILLFKILPSMKHNVNNIFLLERKT